MADKDMLDFLAGLLVEGDTITLDGEPVCFVLGHTGRQVSTVEAAAWIAEACNQASRTCATCKHVDHWTTSEDIDRYACAHNPRSTVAVTGEHFCGYHENKEAPDAER